MTNDTSRAERYIRIIFSLLIFTIVVLLALFVSMSFGSEPFAPMVIIVFMLGYVAGRITRGIDR